MADVVFLLLVFFLLTYTVSPDLTRMTLPRSVVRLEAPRDAAIISIAPPADREVIRVSTGRARSLPVSSDAEIETFVATLVTANPKQPFVIKADRGVRYERIDMVLDTLKRANAREVYLLSEQVTTSNVGE
ncbi:MAG: biopolymer transporter ExbD [Candidatus Sulfomarinibacteraceae bacterium]